MKNPLSLKIDFWGLVAAAGTLLCLFTVTGFLGRSWWLLDLTSHFRIQYAVLLAVFAVIGLIARKWRVALIFGSFMAVNLAVVIPYCFFGATPARHKPAALRVMLINVHTENKHYDLVTKFIRERDPDLVLLEEVNGVWMEDLAELKAAYPHLCEEAREDNFGIALFSKLPLKSSGIIYLGPAEIPSVSAEIEVGGRRMHILGSHPLPPGSSENTTLRNQQLRALAQKIRSWGGSVVLLGDLNTTAWSDSFGQLLRESGLRDSGRGLGLQTTWPANLSPLGIAIDHCLLSADLKVVSRTVGANVGSDHLPLIIELATE